MRLIDADALIQIFEADEKALADREFQLAAIGAANTVRKMPTVDAVQVVRCKDCKYHFYDKKYDISYCSRKDYGYGWKDDDYCSMAERKEE